MADLKYYDVLLKPLMTEKSMKMMNAEDDNGNPKPAWYQFYVHPEATKSQIKEAIERLFTGTKVADVNTMNIKPKKRHRRGFLPGKTVKRKKAIVKLSAGTIEIFEGM